MSWIERLNPKWWSPFISTAVFIWFVGCIGAVLAVFHFVFHWLISPWGWVGGVVIGIVMGFILLVVVLAITVSDDPQDDDYYE